jgi:hypothetical protein
MPDHVKEFNKLLSSLSHRHSDPLSDFCELSALSLANALPIHDEIWEPGLLSRRWRITRTTSWEPS